MIDSVQSSPVNDNDGFEWKEVGRLSLYAICLAAFVSLEATGAAKKKKPITVTSIAGQAVPSIQVQEVQEADPEVPKCDPTDQKKIHEIFDTTARGGLALLRAKSRLEQLGGEIAHIHPFTLLVTVSRSSMKAILDSWMPGVASRVINNIGAGILCNEGPHLDRLIPDFSKKMEKDPEEIRRLIQAREWKNFVHYLYMSDAHEG